MRWDATSPAGAIPAIASVPVKLAATFTDPGRADADRLGRVGRRNHRHVIQDVLRRAHWRHRLARRHLVYGAPDPYEIVATITDDDKEGSAVSFTIQVLSTR